MEIDIYLPDLRLFRPSRPDFIETSMQWATDFANAAVVPAF